MTPEPTPDAAPEFWHSVDQWMGSPAFQTMMRDEFPEDAAEWLDPVSRRQFLQLSAASVALAGAVGCNPSFKPAPQKKVLPYVRQPDEVLPGVPLFFATAMPLAGGVGLGLLVKQTEGRPIKVEGNPNHPSSLGGTDIYSQAAVLGLYDPDRSKECTFGINRGTTYEKVVSVIKTALAANGGRGAKVRILTEPTTSPSLAAAMDELLRRYPEAKWVQYEPLNRDNCFEGTKRAFGRPLNPVYRFDQANVVLSLDSDFLAANTPGAVRYARDFIARRKVRVGKAALANKDGVLPEGMNRLYAVESTLTCTGGTADHRLPVKPSEVELFARALAAELGVASVPAGASLPTAAQDWLKPLAADLKKSPGKALVVVGDHQPAAVHQIAWAINQTLGAVGPLVSFTEPLQPRPANSADEFKQLAVDMAAKQVELLLIVHANPAFDAPADLEFVKALAAVKTSVHLGLYDGRHDETAAQTTYHVNAAHFLEAWGDCRAHDGTVTVQQPLIAPLYNGRTPLELLSAVLELKFGDPLEAVRATAEGLFKGAGQSGDFETWWQHGVRAGVLAGTALPAVTGVRVASADGLGTAPAASTGMEVQFRQDPTLYDGRFNNIGWLQELPRPVTKLTWDNAAIVSPATAQKLGCGIDFAWTGGEHGRAEADVVKLTLNGRTLPKVAVWIMPGQPDDVVTLQVGSGRRRVGKVGQGNNFDVYPLRGTDALWQSGGLQAERTGGTYLLACTQGQYAMEGRRPYRYATAAEYAKDEDFAQVPASSPGEYKDIRALTPGTQEEWERVHKGHAGYETAYPHPHDQHGHSHDHPAGDHDHDEHGAGEARHEGHDTRLIPLSLYPDYPNKINGVPTNVSYRRWGLSIDLGACTGCTACVVACQAENNIPVVGKAQVSAGRAMHWLRIDRYFSIPGASTRDDELGDRDVRGAKRAEQVKKSGEIKTHFQPLMCVHCEKAPCEVVCPVQATAHSADGINEMVYNRCVGTRYCSNNCPYKVRRFNFLQYADYTTESLKLLNNPEVTVRSRGVMEKCTYCIQRIRNAEMETEREWENRPKDAVGRPKIMDGEIVTACQQACPTGAIVFGDINDPGSAVLRAKAEPTTYGLLAEFNTMPRTTYLAAIKNPNADMPKGGA